MNELLKMVDLPGRTEEELFWEEEAIQIEEAGVLWTSSECFAGAERLIFRKWK